MRIRYAFIRKYDTGGKLLWGEHFTEYSAFHDFGEVAMFVAKLRRLAQPLFLAGAFLVLCQFASTVQAMCVYNQANINVYVFFSCGAFCFNEWTTEPNNSYCRPSESGTVGTDSLEAEDTIIYRVEVDVDAHGYVVLSQPSSDRINVCAFHADDSLANCQAFNPDTGEVY